eukprot:TRINITY_DN12737_c0_g1_i1.p2 TRINITY_DN12737_c0_g1~~TRINITY_DN12737_c0_g1_i1.p2  ORF type:complete len:296 (+),score=68.19 TRINITY_DN12737_c0_g1_i1:191-1078(+)
MGASWSGALAADARLGHGRWLCERAGLLLPPYWWSAALTFQVPLWVSIVYCRYGVARNHRWVVAGSTAWLSLVAGFQFMACTQDPGIIPRKADSAAERGGSGLAGQQVMGMCVKDKDAIVYLDDGTPLVYRWCRTCRVHRPPRAAHCDTLGCCVEEYDHFCPILASCVAKRTLRYFVGYMGSVGGLAAWTCGCAYRLSSTTCAPGGADHADILGREYMSLVASVAGGMGLWPILGFVYFMFLIGEEQTSREESRGLANPYAETKTTLLSRLRAIKRVLWDPIPSALVAPTEGVAA